MRSTRVPALVAAGAVGLAGLGIGVVVGPAAASAATSSATKAVGDRVTAIKDALAGLVKDGTITQAQADKVATTLDEKLPPPGFHGHGLRLGAGLDSVARIIGISESDLRTQLRAGKTLAQIAKAKGMSQATLVDKLVAAAKARLAAAVKSGRLTQAQADTLGADLKARVTKLVTTAPPVGRPGWRDGGRRFGGPGTAPGGNRPGGQGSGPGSGNGKGSGGGTSAGWTRPPTTWSAASA